MESISGTNKGTIVEVHLGEYGLCIAFVLCPEMQSEQDFPLEMI